MLENSIKDRGKEIKKEFLSKKFQSEKKKQDYQFQGFGLPPPNDEMMAHGKAIGVLRMKVAQSENSPVPNRSLSRFTVLGGVGWGKKWVRVRVSRVKEDSNDRSVENTPHRIEGFFFLFAPCSPILETITQQAYM